VRSPVNASTRSVLPVEKDRNSGCPGPLVRAEMEVGDRKRQVRITLAYKNLVIFVRAIISPFEIKLGLNACSFC
jgi:hypothetical protein